MPNAAELLKQDHRKVEGLFEQYKGGDRKVVEQICSELKVHTSIEEEHVYPLLAQVDDGQQLREEAEKEHQEVADAISQVEQAGSEAEVEQPMRAIIEGVTHHVQEEETEVLPKLEQALGAARMESLGEQVMAAKHQRMLAEGNIDDLSKDELYELAQTAKVNGRSNMTKQQLRDALRT